MSFQSKHVLIMAILLVASIALVIFVPAKTEHTSNHFKMPPKVEFQRGNGMIQEDKIRIKEEQIETIVVILAKGAIAIVLGIFALFCVCSRFGYCLAKRNKVLLASGPKISADT